MQFELLPAQGVHVTDLLLVAFFLIADSISSRVLGVNSRVTAKTARAYSPLCERVHMRVHINSLLIIRTPQSSSLNLEVVQLDYFKNQNFPFKQANLVSVQIKSRIRLIITKFATRMRNFDSTSRRNCCLSRDALSVSLANSSSK